MHIHLVSSHVKTSAWTFNLHEDPRIEAEVYGGYVRDVGEVVDGSGEVTRNGRFTGKIEFHCHRCADRDKEMVQDRVRWLVEHSDRLQVWERHHSFSRSVEGVRD